MEELVPRSSDLSVIAAESDVTEPLLPLPWYIYGIRYIMIC
jgi:hypothetical protein